MVHHNRGSAGGSKPVLLSKRAAQLVLCLRHWQEVPWRTSENCVMSVVGSVRTHLRLRHKYVTVLNQVTKWAYQRRVVSTHAETPCFNTVADLSYVTDRRADGRSDCRTDERDARSVGQSPSQTNGGAVGRTV